jgi:hypothetical protein
MRMLCVGLLLSFVPLFVEAEQNETSNPRVNSKPLTTEQVAVYRALLEDFSKGINSKINVANTTVPLKDFERGCLTGRANDAESSVPTIHQLNSAILISGNFVLVDLDRQEEVARENDLSNLPRSVFDDSNVPFIKQASDSQMRVFEALSHLTLSEIAFDKTHHHAVVTYAYVCPGLCGHGSTLVLNRVGRRWKISKRCGDWVS